MENEPVKSPKKSNLVPGRKKGGKMYPRVALEQALTYAKKLVSKTAIAAQPEATVLAGVFDSVGSSGKVRLSAIKQFGFLDGTAKGYRASRLAKDIDTEADESERLRLARRAFLNVTVFKELYNTFQSDQASKAKLKGRAQQFGVHPDLAESCTDLFISSALTAKLAIVEGDGIRLVPATQINEEVPKAVPESEAVNSDELGSDDASDAGPMSRTAEESNAETDGRAGSSSVSVPPRPRTAADVKINLTVDSSLDVEKLDKHLASLRRFGLI